MTDIIKLANQIFGLFPENSAKESIRRIIRHRIRTRALINELKKLPISSSGISDDGFPYVSLQSGYKFYGFFPSPQQRELYKFLGKSFHSRLVEDSFRVAIDVVALYVYPYAQPNYTPPCPRFARQGFHIPHRDTIRDIPGISQELKQKLLRKFTIKEGDTFVDAGSYLGYGALKIGKLVGSSGRVIAIECDPDNLKLLQKNVKENNEQILVVPKAVWNKKGELLLRRSEHPASTSLVPGIVQETSALLVQTDTIDNILSNVSVNDVTLISLTINGAELEAIEGMSKTLETCSPTLSIAGYSERNGRPAWEKVMQMLKERGYEAVKGRIGRVFAWKEEGRENEESCCNWS